MESILYARLPDDIVVIRVLGKGNHLNSVALDEAYSRTSASGERPRYVFDLERCEGMDSTFMGVIARIALDQRGRTGTLPAVANMNDHVRSLLDTLGLRYILDLSSGHGDLGADPAFSEIAPRELDKVARIVLMIEAHEKLIDVDSGNEVKFKGVLHTLRESLDRARGN